MTEKTQTFPNVEWRGRMRAHREHTVSRRERRAHVRYCRRSIRRYEKILASNGLDEDARYELDFDRDMLRSALASAPGPNPVRKITIYEPGPGEMPQIPWERIEGGELPIAKVRITCKHQAKLLGLI